MNKKIVLLLIGITIVGAILRLYKLDKFPVSLFGDELDVGYQAYSILKTGKDYTGQPWPVSFHSFADWRTPLYLYTTVPFVALFGLKEISVRLPAALFGIFSIPAFFFLVKKLFKDNEIALSSSAFLGFSMWHLQYSRAAFEVSQMIFLFISGLLLFFKGLEKPKYLSASAFILALTPYSYSTAKLFLPVLLLMLIIIYWEKLKLIKLNKLILPLVITIIISLPMVLSIFFGNASGRFSILSIFSDPTVAPQINFDRQIDSRVRLNGEDKIGVSPTLSSKFVHNKFLYWTHSLINNYFEVFSTNFLFIKGDANYRHSVQGNFGELYWIDALFLLFGLYFLISKYAKINSGKLIIGFLLLSPIPSILTRDGGNHATRLILMLPILIIIMAIGAVNFIKSCDNYKIKISFISLFGIILLFQFYLYLHNYYIHYPYYSEEWWDFGYKEAVNYIKENEYNFDYVVLSDKNQPPLIYTLFWLKIDPKLFQENKLNNIIINESITANNLPGTKYYFGKINEKKLNTIGFTGTLKSNIMYIAPSSEVNNDFRYKPLPESVKLLKTIYYPSGRAAMYILTGK